MEKLLPFVIPHAHGPQDALPLQCVLIRSQRNRADILAWPVPNINAKVTVYDLPTMLPIATLPTRISLSFRSRDDELSPEQCLEILETVLVCLPLDGIVMFDFELRSSWDHNDNCGSLETLDFWRGLSPKWPLLQCVRLTDSAGFLAMLLEDDGGREKPLLPSLTQLVLAQLSLFFLSLRPLREVLMKRIEQGVPVEILDLRNCHGYWPDLHKHSSTEDWLQSLSEIVVDVLVPGKPFDAMEARFWDVVHNPLVDKDHSITGSDDEYEA